MASPIPNKHAVLALAACCTLAQALAQQPQPRPTQRPSALAGQPKPDTKPAAPTPPRAEFSGKFATLDDAGLSIPLPASTLSLRDHNGFSTELTIVPEDQTWRVSARLVEVADKALDITDYTNKAIESLRDRFAWGHAVNPKDGEPTIIPGERVAEAAVLLERSPEPGQKRLQIANNAEPVEFERFYAKTAQGAGKTPVMIGLTAVQLAPAKFVTFQLVCAENHFPAARAAYEAMVAASTFRPLDDVNLQRGTAVSAGKLLFEKLDDKAFASIIQDNAERWYRLYIPAPTRSDADATEVGYMRVRASTGNRGHIDPKRPEKQWTATDRQQGYVLRVDARVLAEGSIFDSEGVYFLSKDRADEAWVVRTAARPRPTPGAKGPAKPAIAEEIGTRSGSNVTVLVRADGAPEAQVRPVIQNDAYISQIDNFLLPQVLVRSRASADYGFYSWQSAQQKIRLRRDSLDQPAGTPDVWKITSFLGDSETPQISYYKSDGSLIRRESPDGSITEPTRFDNLVDLWKSKNLPLD